MTETSSSQLVDQAFWRLPLADRMARFADLREVGPFASATYDNELFGIKESFYVTTRYAEVVEISRRPHDFCSGQGAISVVDMPAEAMEFFGSFINMDDPRHARQQCVARTTMWASAVLVRISVSALISPPGNSQWHFASSSPGYQISR